MRFKIYFELDPLLHCLFQSYTTSFNFSKNPLQQQILSNYICWSVLTWAKKNTQFLSRIKQNLFTNAKKWKPCQEHFSWSLKWKFQVLFKFRFRFCLRALERILQTFSTSKKGCWPESFKTTQTSLDHSSSIGTTASECYCIDFSFPHCHRKVKSTLTFWPALHYSKEILFNFLIGKIPLIKKRVKKHYRLDQIAHQIICSQILDFHFFSENFAKSAVYRNEMMRRSSRKVTVLTVI